MRSPLSVRLFSLLSCLIPMIAPAAVLDIFMAVPQIAGTGDPLIQSKSEILTLPGDFEKRYMGIPFGGGRMEITDEAPGLIFSFVTQMATGANTLGYLQLNSESSEPVNLLGDEETLVQVSFSKLSLPSPIQFQLTFQSAGQPRQVSIYLPAGNQEAAVVYIPMSRFGSVDFSAIRMVSLTGSRFVSGTSFTVDSITTVPEPSASLLSLAGGLFLAFQRSRRK